MEDCGASPGTVINMALADYLTPAEAALVLGTQENTILTWQARGRIGCVDGLVPRTDVELLVNSTVRRAAFDCAKSSDLSVPEAPLTQDDVREFRKLFAD